MNQPNTDPHLTLLTIKIAHDLKRAFKRTCFEQDVPMSVVLRGLMVEHLRQQQVLRR